MPGVLRTTRTDPASPDCGAIRQGNACDRVDPDAQDAGDHDRFVTVYTCNNHSCENPACTRKWTNRRAPAAAARIIGSVYWHEGLNADPIHVTLSPPPNERAPLWEAFEYDTAEAMRLARKKARKIAKKAGLRGGLLVFHAHRCRHQNDAKGRYDNTPLAWSPHWHVVGGGWIIGTSELHDETGWVVVNHRARFDTQGTISYLMDHCAWVEGGDALTYFGYATAHRTRVKKLDSFFEMCRCKGCGAPVRRYPVRDQDIRWDEPLNERNVKVTRYMVEAPGHKDKFPLEFRSAEQEFVWRIVKPPPDPVYVADLTTFGLEQSWSSASVPLE